MVKIQSYSIIFIVRHDSHHLGKWVRNNLPMRIQKKEVSSHIMIED